MRISTRQKISITVLLSAAVFLICVSIGSVRIPIFDIIQIIGHIVFGFNLSDHITQPSVAILWSTRLPRVLLAFFAGSSLSVSGAVMQSILRNPLASSFTLGVSSGASLGASLVIFLGVSLPILTLLTLPLLGFLFGLGTIILSITFASRLDSRMENNTIILTGMVFSLFINAITTLMFALYRESIQRMIFWQMGSFSMRDWQAILILAPVTIAGVLYIFRFKQELDIMTFGDEQAKTIGINSVRVKWKLLISSAAITGSTIAFTGVIGFIDLVTPHVIRKIFGSSHKYVIPMSALAGGAFMALCDLAARMVLPFRELPVGAVTAIIGAPFFAYVFFSKRNR